MFFEESMLSSQAIGDALGLGAEFLSKDEILTHYPNSLKDYSQLIQDKHRSRWEIGDWTDDTDQFLFICNSIINTNKIDELVFAEELYKWFKDSPMGIGKIVYTVVSVPQFTLYPNKASEIMWKLSKQRNASNGAIMRTSILGTYEFWDYNKVTENTEKIAKVTHWDSRCVGSRVIITMLITNILFESKLLNLEKLCDIAEKYDSRIIPYIESAYSSPVEDLKLDESESIGYTLEALSAGLWAYFIAENCEDGLLKIVNEGGDADTNACVAGSVLGAKFGYSSIPKKYIDSLKNKDFLEVKYNEYIKQLKESYTHYNLTKSSSSN